MIPTPRTLPVGKKMPPRKRNKWPQALVQIVAVLAFFSPFVCRAEYIKAVNYFGKSWTVAFWNSDLSEVSADLQDIRRDGFNSIILIVPWGEFQPGLDPIHFNDDAYHRLTSVCNQAHSAGFKVFLRVSYTWDFYPSVQQPNTDRTNGLISGASLIPAWDQYLAKINAATRRCSEGAFISWEDFWDAIAKSENLKTPEERAAYSKQMGYAAWIDQHADNTYKARYAADLRKFGVYPIPNRDNPDYEMVFQYFDDQMMNKLLPVLAKNFRQASVEARIDSDPIYNGKELLKWHAHPQHYSVTSSDFLMTYWAPGMDAVNQGEKDSSEKVIDRFNTLHRSLLAQIPKQLFIGQWLFKDNTPGFHFNAQVNPPELSRFIRDSARPLAQFTAGYALWNWRDYRRSYLFNGFFSLGKLGWDFSPGSSIQTFPDGAYAQLPQGQSIHQDIQRMHDRHKRKTVRLRFTARGNGRVRVDIGSASQEVNIQAAPGARAVVTLQFPTPSPSEPTLASPPCREASNSRISICGVSSRYPTSGRSITLLATTITILSR